MFRLQHHPLSILISSHIKPAFEKLLSEHALDAWVAKQRLVMVATRGHRYSRLPYHSSADTLLSWLTGLQTYSSSCLAPIYTLPLWMTLLLFPSLRVVVTSMEFFCPPCHLLFLPIPRPCYCCCCLLKDYHDVTSIHINKLSINPSALEMCAPKTIELHDFKFLLYPYHVYDSTLQCVEKFFEASPLCCQLLPLLLQLRTPCCSHKFYWFVCPIQQRAIPNIYTYSGSSIESNNFFRNPVQIHVHKHNDCSWSYQF